jgi:hypothetical protein
MFPRAVPASVSVGRFKQEKDRVRSTQAGVENVMCANPAVCLHLPVGDGQVHGAFRFAESNNRNGVGSLEQSG